MDSDTISQGPDMEKQGADPMKARQPPTFPPVTAAGAAADISISPPATGRSVIRRRAHPCCGTECAQRVPALDMITDLSVILRGTMGDILSNQHLLPVTTKTPSSI
ncbi:hypothetical protein EYF80_045492 [Liparis tanakae]|uniref:Uncharacterized protein n=1 Tax=Liparis tanakae TaxID=230148 RepID=A0A4Z2FT37_9TELE|nr:hypothetical protein EYF80_045492 [Liparis tanakae]